MLKTNVTGTRFMLTSQDGRKWTLRDRNWNTVNRRCGSGHKHALVLHSLNRGIITARRLEYSGSDIFDGSPCLQSVD